MRRKRYADVDVQVGQRPPADMQFIDTKKFGWTITFSFNRILPGISAERMGKLNQLLISTEGDRLLFGIHFVTINTDDPDKYDREYIADLICACYGYHAAKVRLLETVSRG